MHSRKKIDRCGKCGGKADSCIDEKSSFIEKIAGKRKKKKKPGLTCRLTEL